MLSQPVPKASRFFLLINPNVGGAATITEVVQRAASIKGVELEVLKATNEAEIDAVFASAFRDRGGPLIVVADQLFARRRQQVVSLATRYSVPTIFSGRQSVVDGGLISYAANVVDIFRQVGVYAGKILNGASPSDLPVEQPARFDLAVNLATARALKLEVPSTILVIADLIIE
jgi:putative ABC transport system substrate-binding protein